MPTRYYTVTMQNVAYQMIVDHYDYVVIKRKLRDYKLLFSSSIVMLST